MKNTIKVAVTGGIGSGKSAVLGILKELGYQTISSDSIVLELYKSRAFKKRIKKEFPSCCKGLFSISIDKKALSKEVFADKEKLKILNSITHPFVMDRIENFFNLCDKEIAFAEVPLLFEGNFQDKFDEIMVILRPIEERIKSVKARSNLSEEEIISRIKNQTDYERLEKDGLVVIDNTKQIQDLFDVVRIKTIEILEKYHKSVN